jgi:glyoxylase-like metal-dependent hydrolase (beta-lactamase superfamily II)
MKSHARLALYLAGIAMLAGRAAQAQPPDFAAVEIAVHEVAGNIYYLEGAGGNVGLSVGDDGVLMIDDQFAPLSDKLVAAIRTLSDDPIRFLINTHIHGDHTGGNENFGNMGVPIIAHDNVRVRLVQGVGQAGPAPEAARPVLTYGDTLTVHVNGEEVRVLKVPPAHTDGDSYVHFTAADVIHVGDVFRTTGYPRIDLNNGGTLEGTLEALQIAIDMAGPDTKLIPGHGVVSTRDAVIEFRDMIVEVRRRVSELIEQGMTQEQAVAANPTADLDERWGSSEGVVAAFYQALQNEM